MDSPLIHRHFIATPLLPCALPGGTNIIKYTGNNALGTDLLDQDITKAVHAFTHFCMKYTGDALLFCDLQGLFINMLNLREVQSKLYFQEPLMPMGKSASLIHRLIRTWIM